MAQVRGFMQVTGGARSATSARCHGLQPCALPAARTVSYPPSCQESVQCGLVTRRCKSLRCSASSQGAAITPEPDNTGPSGGVTRYIVAGLVAAALVGAYFQFPSFQVSVHGWLQYGRSTLQSFPGFVESLTLVFMSELGDKTFFIAALLAMKLGRAIAFTGSVASLTLMTVISVMIGRIFASVPSFVDTSAPIGQYAGAALLVYFGIRSILAGLRAGDDGEELADAETELQEAEKSGKIHLGGSTLAAFWEVASLIFIAEWGDRSMMATIALAVQSNPWGVTLGASAGHALATIIAVVAGAWASKYISERMVSLIGGVLFLLFAAETALGLGIL